MTVDNAQQMQNVRKMTNAQEVILHAIPRWFSERIAEYRKAHGMDVYAGCEYGEMKDAICTIVTLAGLDYHCCGLLDHWGTSIGGPYKCCYDAGECFVIEPYGFGSEYAKMMDAIAGALNLEWHVSSNTWWCPGRTVRITLHKKMPW